MLQFWNVLYDVLERNDWKTRLKCHENLVLLIEYQANLTNHFDSYEN